LKSKLSQINFKKEFYLDMQCLVENIFLDTLHLFLRSELDENKSILDYYETRVYSTFICY